MKKICFLVLIYLVSLLSQLQGQEKKIAKTPEGRYNFETNILYYNVSEARVTDDIRRDCRLDIYYPKDQKNYATVIWFHGGGLTGGKRFIPEELKEQNIAVVAVEYRLSPKVKCPAYIEDAASAIAWVFKNIHKYGGSPRQIYVSGHSAGGYLALMTGLDKFWLRKYNLDSDSIAALIPLSGQVITHFTIRRERGIPDYQPVIDEFAPLYHVRKDAPPLILITGDRELEMLGRYEENAYMMRMMKTAGHKKTVLHELDGFDHGSMPLGAYPLLLKYVREISKTR